MAKKRETEEVKSENSAPKKTVKPSAYRVELPKGMAMVVLSNRTLFVDDEGYVIVSPAEYEELKGMLGR